MRNEAHRIDNLWRSWVVFCNDLRLLSALYVAHFIVWRELRRLENGELH